MYIVALAITSKSDRLPGIGLEGEESLSARVRQYEEKLGR